MIYTYQSSYPEVKRSAGHIHSLNGERGVGLDFEWDIKTETPTIIGVSDGQQSVSVPFEEGWGPARELLEKFPDAEIIGHNVIRAEKPICEKYGMIIPLERWGDTIIWHYLVNAHLCKAGGKALGDLAGGELERRGPGFMNIWTMCSIHTSSPCWKFCRESECHGVPCPKHDVFWYNGLDAREPVNALVDMKRKAKLLGVDSLYPMHRRLNEVFYKMSERGVWVNKAYIDDMREDFHHMKEELWQDDQETPTEHSLPFNPRSHDQVKKWFKDHYDLAIKDNKEETIRELVNKHSEVTGDEDDWNTWQTICEIPELADLLAYKEIGSGPDRWFAPLEWNEKAGEWDGYVRDEGGGLGTIHPNINHFTSTGRTNCSRPNLYNVEKRRVDRHQCTCGHRVEAHKDKKGDCKESTCQCTGFKGENVGKRMRKAVVAPEGYYLGSADYSNGENLAMLHYAGYTDQIDRNRDLHLWMAELSELKESDDFSLRMGGLRDAAKSVTHAADYLEGLDLCSPEKLRSMYVQREIKAGARLVFPEWKFKDFTVTFTGGNLALRAFGSKEWGNRKAALEIVGKYIDQTFPKIRDVQKMITKQIEQQGMVKVPHGYCLRSYAQTPGDMLKTGVAMWGSNPIAHYLKLAMINAENHPRILPVLGVHDEIVFYFDRRHEPKQIKKDMQDVMCFDTPEMRGFRLGIKFKYGPNWKDTTEVKG